MLLYKCELVNHHPGLCYPMHWRGVHHLWKHHALAVMQARLPDLGIKN